MKNKALKQIQSELEDLPDTGIDLGDLGNSLALAVGTLIDENREGFSINDFKAGVEHGLLLLEEGGKLISMRKRHQSGEGPLLLDDID